MYYKEKWGNGYKMGINGHKMMPYAVLDRAVREFIWGLTWANIWMKNKKRRVIRQRLEMGPGLRTCKALWIMDGFYFIRGWKQLRIFHWGVMQPDFHLKRIRKAKVEGSGEGRGEDQGRKRKWGDGDSDTRKKTKTSLGGQAPGVARLQDGPSGPYLFIIKQCPSRHPPAQYDLNMSSEISS